MKLLYECYLDLRGSMVVLLVSESPLLSIRVSICVKSVDFLMWVFCWLWSCLILQVNFACVGCWLSFPMIIIPLVFAIKFHRFPYLLGGKSVAASALQHLHQRGWARESMSLDNHPLLRYPFPLIMWYWKSKPFTINLQLLGVGSMSLLIWCVSLALMLLGMLCDSSLVLLFMLSLASPCYESCSPSSVLSVSVFVS